jgi:putative acetyltransferase
MQIAKYEVKAYTDDLRQQVLNVWEASVLATHDFLSPHDFSEIKEIVKTIDFNAFQVYCMVDSNHVLGFIGVADKKIEMLFLDPNYFGLGLGKRLTDFAKSELNADMVDVNEQNVKAVKFYKKSGFKAYERTDKDDQGRSYPLLRMKLES